MIVLCVNSGSSSVKLALFRGEERLASASVGRVTDHGHAVHQGLDDLEARGFPPPDAAGHRFVHGGPQHHAPVLLDSALIASLREAVPYVLSLLGIRETEPAIATIDARVRRERTFEALRRILLREAIERPLIIVIEDLHWIDSESQAFLELFVRSVAIAKVLLLVR